MKKDYITLSIILVLNILALTFTISLSLSDKRKMMDGYHFSDNLLTEIATKEKKVLLNGNYLYIKEMSLGARRAITNLLIHDRFFDAWEADLYVTIDGDEEFERIYSHFKDDYQVGKYYEAHLLLEGIFGKNWNKTIKWLGCSIDV